MKHLLHNLLFIIFSLAATATATSQIVNIPDANFKAFLVGKSSINTNGDSEIQVSEATAFYGSMVCDNKNISDLTGIEAFVNMQDLWCHNNQIISLNLSSNIALNRVYCNDNPLEFLDASNNTGVKEINAYRCNLASVNLTNCTALTDFIGYENNLTTVDLSTNLALKEVSFSYNQLVSLDISNNLNITGLEVNNNQLLSLNANNGNNTNFTFFLAQNNPALTCIQVDDAAYSTANWNDGGNFKIDPQASFSENCVEEVVYIPDANFKAYLVGNSTINTNNDSEIQVSEAAGYAGAIDCRFLDILDLTGIGYFSTLTELDCSYNQLTSLDLSNCISLQKLNTFQNQLTSININGCANLKILSLSDNQLTDLDVSSNTALEIFVCDQNQLQSLDVTNNVELTTLFFSDNQLTYLNVANGNNTNILSFFAQSNPDLICIQVDDENYSTTNWFNQEDFGFDPQTSFSENCTIGIKENILSSSIKIYPNPTKDQVYFSKEVNVQLSSITGQVLANLKNIAMMDLSKQATGIYFLTITDFNGQILQRSKIIKE
ncbi:T9SS type A sorting domain-containing protein [Winogradskyella sp.]|uniref:T9SS type A sorting domain-containing protein n=1 Tax=Winogradskyella sp. TaxID=1883156 RepID=UPI003AB84996